jgi:hypothetical protein
MKLKEKSLKKEKKQVISCESSKFGLISQTDNSLNPRHHFN